MKIILFISLCIVSVLATDRPCKKYTVNGCSIPGDPKGWYEDLFTESCDHHDVCYYCHKTYGKTQLYCDQLMLNLTLKQCVVGDHWCVVAATIYFKVVHTFGGKYFKNYETPLHFCNEAWVPDCM